MKPIGVVIPTYLEACDFLKRFNFKRDAQRTLSGSVKGTAVKLEISGIGAEGASKAAFKLCAQGAGMLVSAGFCGALTDQVQVGDVVRERMADSDRPVASPEARRLLAQKNSAIAVDMESRAVIEAGTRRGVPIRLVRIVSDSSRDDLTPLFNGDVHFSPFKIAFRLLNPQVWPLALRLARQSRLARARLADALSDFLSSPS